MAVLVPESLIFETGRRVGSIVAGEKKADRNELNRGAAGSRILVGQAGRGGHWMLLCDGDESLVACLRLLAPRNATRR